MTAARSKGLFRVTERFISGLAMIYLLGTGALGVVQLMLTHGDVTWVVGEMMDWIVTTAPLVGVILLIAALLDRSFSRLAGGGEDAE